MKLIRGRQLRKRRNILFRPLLSLDVAIPAGILLAFFLLSPAVSLAFSFSFSVASFYTLSGSNFVSVSGSVGRTAKSGEMVREERSFSSRLRIRAAEPAGIAPDTPQ